MRFRRAVLPYLLAAVVIGTLTHFVFRSPKIIFGCTVNVLTSAAIAKPWSAAPELLRAFEAREHCRVRLLAHVGEESLLEALHRTLKQADSALHPDVVMGFEFAELESARNQSEWHPVAVPTDLVLSTEFPEAARRETDVTRGFVPISWSPLTFVYRRPRSSSAVAHVPANLDDLLAARWHRGVALEDPSTSLTGFLFLPWVLALKGESAGWTYLGKFKEQLRSLSSSSEDADALLRSGEASLAWEDLSALPMHWIKDGDESYQPVVFSEGHPYSVTYAGVLNTCSTCWAAKKMVQSLLTADSQGVLMRKGFRLPVRTGVSDGTPFARLPKLKLVDLNPDFGLESQRRALLEHWSALKVQY